MNDERGGIPLALVIAAGILVALIFGIGVCGDALFDDEDEADDLGWVPLTELAGDGDDNRGGRNKNGRDCEGSQDCSTLSPSFQDSPVKDSFNPQICVMPGSCTGESDRPS